MIRISDLQTALLDLLHKVLDKEQLGGSVTALPVNHHSE